MNIYLIKSSNKRSIRLWLRQNQILHIRRSSIYTIANFIYLVIKLDNLDIVNNHNISVLDINTVSPVEQQALLWGTAEINKTIDFIQFESNSILGNNGRIIDYNNILITRTFDHLAELMAIINYNNNSFSDGGQYNKPDLACNRILEQLAFGATIIDIGIESTRYIKDEPPNIQHEIQQLNNLLPEVIALKKIYNFQISIDTYHPSTVEYLLDLDIDIINDVSGKLPLELIKQCTLNNKKYIGMHSLTIPTDKSIFIDLASNSIEVIRDWIAKLINQMDEANINLNQIILDPGIGFGKNAAQDWFILKNMNKFYDSPCEILLGHSRKWLHNQILELEFNKRDLPSSLIAAKLIKDIDYVRMHDLSNLNTLHRVIHELS